jgi:hypothetical protein
MRNPSLPRLGLRSGSGSCRGFQWRGAAARRLAGLCLRRGLAAGRVVRHGVPDVAVGLN